MNAWGGSLDKRNNNNGSKVIKYKEQEINKISKFSGDYSENFDKDLEEALKRSMMEK